MAEKSRSVTRAMAPHAWDVPAAVELVQRSGQSARFVSGIGAAVPALTLWLLMTARSDIAPY